MSNNTAPAPEGITSQGEQMQQTDRAALESAEKAIREALAAGPTHDEWQAKEATINGRHICWQVGVGGASIATEVLSGATIGPHARRIAAANAAHIAAANPAALTLILAELDSLRAALAAAPAAIPEPRQPLTDEQLDALAIDEDGLPNSHIEFARAIERVHGIGAAPAAGEQQA